MVARGELKGISIGYRVNTWTIISEEDGHETWRATRWELLEVSLVPVPADANAGVRAAGGPTPSAITEEEDDMRRNLTGGATTAAIAATAACVAATAPGADRSPPRPCDGSRAAPHPRRSPLPAPPRRLSARFSGAEAVGFVEQARAFGTRRGPRQRTGAAERARRNRRRSRPQFAADIRRRNAARRNRAGTRRPVIADHARRRRNHPQRDRRSDLRPGDPRSRRKPRASIWA
jgi:hypothetical protein